MVGVRLITNLYGSLQLLGRNIIDAISGLPLEPAVRAPCYGELPLQVLAPASAPPACGYLVALLNRQAK